MGCFVCGDVGDNVRIMLIVMAKVYCYDVVDVSGYVVNDVGCVACCDVNLSLLSCSRLLVTVTDNIREKNHNLYYTLDCVSN